MRSSQPHGRSTAEQHSQPRVAWFASNADLVVPRGHGSAPGNGTLVNAVRTVTGT